MDDADVQLESMDREECLRRLAARRFGRLAVVADGYPQVFCVNYGIRNGQVVFRTHESSALLAACDAPVGFQVDEIDEHGRQGWSVLIQGVAQDVTSEETTATLEVVDSWAPGEKTRLITILPLRITGRELTVRHLGWPLDSSGYL